MTPFFVIAPGLGAGEPPPTGWRPIADLPLLVIVGVTGVGKSTMLGRLAALGLPHRLLPDRRVLTDALIITAMQRLDDAPIQPVTDRRLRFDYTRRYRELHPGGMAQALAGLVVDCAASSDGLLIFDGLRGENEIEWAVRLLPRAHFVMLDAPDVVRVQRLLGRRDAFDRVAETVGEAAGAGFAALGVADAAGLFTPAEERSLLALVESGAVSTAELRAKLEIVMEERRSYDPATTRAALLSGAGERALVIDTTRCDADAAARLTARQARTWGIAPGSTKNLMDNGQAEQDLDSLLPDNLRIERIDARIFRLPMRGELRWGKASSLAEARHVLISVTLSDGSVGYGEAPPRPTIYGETEASIVSVIERELTPRLAGQLVSRAYAQMQEIKFNHAAKGGLDMAIHDAVAASRGVHLADLLGSRSERVRVSYILGIGTRDEALAEAQRVVSQGVRVLKVKVGRDWEDDLARMDELAATLGPGVALYADANECMTPDEAPTRLAILAERGLLYCEEPLPVELIRERARLVAGRHLPIIADDSAFSLRDLRRELALETFDILNIKTARTGFTESVQMLAAARRGGKGVMVGSQASAGLGTLHAGLVSTLPGVEHPCELSFFLKLKEDITAPVLPIHDGFVHLDDLRRVRLDLDQLKNHIVQP